MKWLGMLVVAAMVPGHPVSGAEPLAEVVAELDAMRLPERSFKARLEISEPGKLSQFRLFARKGASGFRVMMVCDAPPADAGKRLLFAGESAWLHDPRARRATRIAPRQLWGEGAFVDSLSWSLARDFEARDLGEKRLEVAGGAEGPRCRVIEFQPKGSIRGQAGTMRYWIDGRGWPRQVEHLSPGGRPWRTVHALELAQVMGRDRPTVLRVQSRGRTRTLKTSGQQAMEVPEAWVDEGKFGAVEVE